MFSQEEQREAVFHLAQVEFTWGELGVSAKDYAVPISFLAGQVENLEDGNKKEVYRLLLQVYQLKQRGIKDPKAQLPLFYVLRELRRLSPEGLKLLSLAEAAERKIRKDNNALMAFKRKLSLIRLNQQKHKYFVATAHANKGIGLPQ